MKKIKTQKYFPKLTGFHSHSVRKQINWTVGAHSIDRFGFNLNPYRRNIINTEINAETANIQFLNKCYEFNLLKNPKYSKILSESNFWELCNFVFGQYKNEVTPINVLFPIFTYISMTFFEDDKMEHDIRYCKSVLDGLSEWYKNDMKDEFIKSNIVRFYVTHVFEVLMKFTSKCFVNKLIEEHMVYLIGLQLCNNKIDNFDEFIKYRLCDIGIYPWWAILQIIANKKINVTQDLLTLLAKGCLIQNDMLSIERDLKRGDEPNITYYLLHENKHLSMDDLFPFVETGMFYEVQHEITKHMATSDLSDEDIDGLSNFLDGITKWYQTKPLRYISTTSPYKDFLI